jgi:tetratricopeptide (TPR) repeat protein
MSNDIDSPELDIALHLIGKDSQKALDICKKFKENNPNNSWVNHVMTLAHRRMGNHTAMYAAANDCVKQEPSDDMSYQHRAEAAYHLENYQDAIADAKTAIKHNHDGTLGSLPHRLAALSYARLGDVKNAVGMANKMPELEPNEWYPKLGPLPAGTKSQFTEMVKRTAQNVQQGRVNNIKS